MNAEKRIIVLRDGKRTLRVRREEFGCIVFDSANLYAEGNDTVFEILGLISDGARFREIVDFLCSKYGIPRGLGEEHVGEFLEQAHELGWLGDVWK